MGLLAILAAALPLSALAADQLQFSPTRLRFGRVIVGQSVSEIVTVRNAGATATTLSAISISGPEFTVSNPGLPLLLAPGQSVDLTVVFAPTTPAYVPEVMTFTDDASYRWAYLPISGIGVITEPLVASPLSLSFGNVPVGTTVTRTVTLTNRHGWNQPIQSIYTMSPAFSVTAPLAPMALAPGQTIVLQVTFAPQATGLSGSSVFIQGPAVDIPLTGTGTSATVGQLSATPASLSFGGVNVGSVSSKAITLSASAGSVTVSSAGINNSEFTISGASFPLTINPGQSLTFDVAFSPNQNGAGSGTLTFVSNASDGQLAEPLAGTGTQPQFSVNLSWSPSTSAVVGYNVYRGTTPGNYARINPSVEANTAYTDNTVASGTTYYYAATAVNSSGQESSYSTPLKVVVQ